MAGLPPVRVAGELPPPSSNSTCSRRRITGIRSGAANSGALAGFGRLARASESPVRSHGMVSPKGVSFVTAPDTVPGRLGALPVQVIRCIVSRLPKQSHGGEAHHVF